MENNILTPNIGSNTPLSAYTAFPAIHQTPFVHVYSTFDHKILKVFMKEEENMQECCKYLADNGLLKQDNPNALEDEVYLDKLELDDLRQFPDLRFLREAYALNKLKNSHPNIYSGEVKLFISKYKTRPMILTEKVGDIGYGLREELDNYFRESEPDVKKQNFRSILLGLKGIASAIDYLGFNESFEVVHRDVKPKNILIKDEQFILIDFGLALFAEITTGIALGTPSYLPPEQAIGIDLISTYSDQFGFGVILAELLIGSQENILKRELTPQTVLYNHKLSNYLDKRKFERLATSNFSSMGYSKKEAKFIAQSTRKLLHRCFNNINHSSRFNRTSELASNVIQIFMPEA